MVLQVNSNSLKWIKFKGNSHLKIDLKVLYDKRNEFGKLGILRQGNNLYFFLALPSSRNSFVCSTIFELL